MSFDLLLIFRINVSNASFDILGFSNERLAPVFEILEIFICFHSTLMIRTSITMWKKCDNTSHSCLVHDLKKNISKLILF